MTPRISIAISMHYVTVDEFELVLGINHRTVKRHTSESKLLIRKNTNQSNTENQNKQRLK